MKDEVNSAAGFLARLLLARNVAPVTVEKFRKKLTYLLLNHYQDHWFPEKPYKGSGYRCIRFNHYVNDPIVEKASRSCGMSVEAVRSLFPREFTMWVDPMDVSYRIGENGSIGVLYCTAANDNCNNSFQERLSNVAVAEQHKQTASHLHQLQPEANLSTCGQQANQLHQQLQYHAEMPMVYS